VAEDDDGPVTESEEKAAARQTFRHAVDLMKAQDYAGALPLFLQLTEMSEVGPKGYDSCIANIAICAHQVGDHTTGLAYAAMFLDSDAQLGSDERMRYLELFFASYKGHAGIIFHNPYNEYG
jgi:hypothetical protein